MPNTVKNKIFFTHILRKVTKISTLILFLLVTVVFSPNSIMVISQTSYQNKPIKLSNDNKTIEKVLDSLNKLDPNKPGKQKNFRYDQKKNEIVVEQSKVKFTFNTKTRAITLKTTKGETTFKMIHLDKLDNLNIVDNKAIFSSKDSATDVILEFVEGGFRQIINLKNNKASDNYRFEVKINKGEKLEVKKDGSALVKDKDGKVKLIIAKPWAVDSKKKNLKTYYKVDKNSIIQYIELKGATFPVLADPLWCGDVINTPFWVNDNTYNENYWMIRIQPTWCGRVTLASLVLNFNINPYQTSFNFGSDVWNSWGEVVSKTPDSSEWNKEFGTPKYWSLFDQFVCHLYNPATVAKEYYNIEPHRPNVGMAKTYAEFCNP